MTSSTTSTNLCAGYEPIAGYKLEQLIGRGGFGEVWRSEAPGGLHKAVKFVYGATDQHRAVRELRSLERIKGVHHPFLLTLERFGVVDDRLVIVTELADGSLEEVYTRHRERGSCGIPRASLLAYLHDAADALDYLHSNYQLQHLDIKPGNLLLVGGHVKVGDFGLLKDLRDADCSMVGGLTPVYAPPELFDGRPSLHSDQYSLAVMYQELLTGTRPFGGRTIAQLATQHVHSAPNLSPLPAADRPIIARALEKDPQRRFASCCELIEQLRATASRSLPSGAVAAPQEQGDTLPGDYRAGLENPAPAVKNLPQLNVSAARSAVQITSHVLVVAIGGEGAKILHLLRDRVASHRAACPMDLHSILIDTDAASIQATRQAEASDRVPVCQSIHTPLRSPQDYRSYQGAKYKSISRRWLYNIPRSGATEGMRPLGRLALVDHGKEVLGQLEESIRHLSAVAGNTAPSVYVVGSIDGGTGSGMVLDVLHLIRHVLDNQALAHVPVQPLLVTGPIKRDPKRPLAASDAAATLAEMEYFLSPGNGYPGDSAASWPSVPSARTPLVDTYLIAASSSMDGVAPPAETVSEYLWANCTGAGDFFAAAREDARDDAQAGQLTAPQLRSVGMVRLRTPKLLEENLLAPSIVRQLLYKWLGDPAEAKALANDLAAKLMRRCGLTPELLIKHCCGRWPVDPELRFGQLQDTIALLPEAMRNNPAQLQHALQAVATQTLGNPDASSGFTLLEREISIRLSDGRCDLALAIGLLKRMEQLVKRAAEDARDGRCGDVVHPVSHAMYDAGDLERQAHVWLSRIICCKVSEWFDELADSIAKLRERISDRAATLAHCVYLVSQRLVGSDDDVWRCVEDGIRSRVASVMENLDRQVSSSVVGLAVISQEAEAMTSEKLLQSLLERALPLIDRALNWEGDESKMFGGSRLASLNGPSSIETPAGEPRPQDANGTAGFSNETDSTTPSEALPAARPRYASSLPTVKPQRWDDPEVIAAAIRAVRPVLLDCGGCQRLLLVVGSEPERERLEPKIQEVHNGPLTTMVVPGAAAMLVCEAQQIRLADVRSRIITVAANDQNVLARLSARNDINWTASTLLK